MKTMSVTLSTVTCVLISACSHAPPPEVMERPIAAVVDGQPQPAPEQQQELGPPPPPPVLPEASRLYPGPCRVLHDYQNPQNMVPDGAPDTIVTKVYDGKNLISEVAIQKARNAESPGSTRRAEHTYGAKGLRTSTTKYRSSALGETKSRTTYRYDRMGKLVEQRLDEGVDGTVDWRDEIRRDGEGRRTFFREMIKAKTGRVGLNRRYVYENGRLSFEDVDNDGDGTFNLRIHYTYDDAGRVRMKQRDWEMDGAPEETRLFTYDQDGRLVEEMVRTGDGARPGTGTLSFYDFHGNLLRELDVVEHSREVTHRRTYEYGCFDD